MIISLFFFLMTILNFKDFFKLGILNNYKSNLLIVRGALIDLQVD